jgi:aminoglycoside/choline kinase family phosphotransferase
MDAPPEREDCAPFAKVAGLMAAAGLNVPRVLAWDQPQGFILLDDLGTRTMIEVVDPEPARDAGALPARGGRAGRLQLASKPASCRPMRGPLARELALFPDWYLGKHRG